MGTRSSPQPRLQFLFLFLGSISRNTYNSKFISDWKDVFASYNNYCYVLHPYVSLPLVDMFTELSHERKVFMNIETRPCSNISHLKLQIVNKTCMHPTLTPERSEGMSCLLSYFLCSCSSFNSFCPQFPVTSDTASSFIAAPLT
jgi:hypothetical protein